MLVLTRKTDQKVVIGPDIVVTVLEIRGNRVRLGIEAPREIPVHRSELVPVHRNGLPTGTAEEKTTPLYPPATV